MNVHLYRAAFETTLNKKKWSFIIDFSKDDELWCMDLFYGLCCFYQIRFVSIKFFLRLIFCARTHDLSFYITKMKSNLNIFIKLKKKNENLFEYSIAVAILCANGFYIRLCLFSKVNILKRKFDPYPFVHNAVFFLQNYISFQFKWYDAL